MPDDLIPLDDAAELIGKNLRTIQRYLQSGRLKRYEKDDKNFVSRRELETNFPSTTKSAKETTNQTTTPRPQKPSVASGDNYWQKKWSDEIEKHAQTREELGQWKGRAEAYQAFAARLLGNGETNINVDNLNQAPEIKKDEPVGVNRPPQNYSFVYYLAFAVLFVILILLFVLIRIYTG